MDSQRIVITGLGVLACNGIGRRAYWDSLSEGRSGIRTVDRFDPSEFPCHLAGQLWDYQPEDHVPKRIVRNWCRHVHQAVAAAKMSVADAGLDKAGYDPERVSTAFGTSVGSPNEEWEAHQEIWEKKGYTKLGKLASSKFTGHSATVHVTIECGFRGPALTIGSGCATGLDVVTWGAQQIRAGRIDAAVVGATETPVFPMCFASAACLGILSSRNDEPARAMRPFDSQRDGIVLSEAAVAVTIERLDHAVSRGAPILAEVCGAASAAEGMNPLILDPEGKAMARAIEGALSEACVAPTEIEHIQAHGASIQMYDRSETNAYKRAFGEHAYRIPISAVKSMVGQPYSVGGLIGLGAALMVLEEGVVPPTINLDDPDPECDLDFVPHRARVNDIRTAMVCAMSFGGNHSATILRRYAA